MIDDLDDSINYKVYYQKNKIVSKIEYSSSVYDKEIIFELDDKTNLSTVYRTVFNRVYYKHRKARLLKSVMKKYMNIINQSKNGAWHVREHWKWDYLYISIVASNRTEYKTYIKIVEPYSKNSIERQLCSIMNELATGLYSDIRLLEVDNSIG